MMMMMMMMVFGIYFFSLSLSAYVPHKTRLCCIAISVCIGVCYWVFFLLSLPFPSPDPILPSSRHFANLQRSDQRARNATLQNVSPKYPFSPPSHYLGSVHVARRPAAWLSSPATHQPWGLTLPS
ncbi:hypothetical protein B0T21DRAFT_14422 [Apiosordaria backusii]|uniref:Secreted peptide n=1 Tax=Apiosordaria backusii TaxID=314023 RepID=A0AA40K7A5_9PEZI|nr:hypothetical protein B0T21DRAFT_14422 [Apiosordaria backusii]